MKKQGIDKEKSFSSWDTIQQELISHIARWTSAYNECQTEVPGLLLLRHEKPTEPNIGLTEPSICMIAQGAK